MKGEFSVRKMKRLLSSAVLMLLLLSSVQGCYKVNYRSFIRNECGQSVTVSYMLGEDSNRYVLENHQVVEIPDIDRWQLVSTPERFSVYFEYADGIRVIHTCGHVLREDGTGEYVFQPAENNILLDNLSNTSWKISHHPHNEIFKEYCVR